MLRRTRASILTRVAGERLRGYLTIIVITFDITGGICGTWAPSPITSCKVCEPGTSQDCLRLTFAEMQMLAVVRNRLVHLRRRQCCVDQQVKMAESGLIAPAGSMINPVEPNLTVVPFCTVSPSFTFTK